MSFACGTLLLHSQQTDVVKLQFWAAIGVLAGIFLFVRGFSMLRCKRIIMNTPASKVRSASMGLVEISGMAKGPQTIPAGITGEACFYYRAMAWQLRQSGRNREWKKVADESLYVPFFVEDNTGHVLVDPQGAELDIHRNFKDQIGDSLFSSGDLMPDNAAAFMLRNGIDSSETTRLEEYCIKPDYPLFVLGTLGQNPAGQDWIPTRHVEASSFKSHFRLFGPTGSGVFRSLGWAPGLRVATDDMQVSPVGMASHSSSVSLESSKLAGDAASGAASPSTARWSSVSLDEEGLQANAAVSAQDSPGRPRSIGASDLSGSGAAVAMGDSNAGDDSTPQVTATALEQHPSVAIGKGTGNQPYMISWRSQREVVQSLSWKSALCIWGGPALTLGCVYFLILSLGGT